MPGSLLFPVRETLLTNGSVCGVQHTRHRQYKRSGGKKFYPGSPLHIFLKLALLVEYTADRCKNGGIPERKQRGKQDRSICDRRLHKPGKQSVEPIIGQGDRFAVYDRIHSGKKYGEQHRPDDTRRNGTARLFNDRSKSKEQRRIAENGQQLRRQCSDRVPLQACSRFKEDSARYKSSAPCHEAKDDGRRERGDQLRKIYRCSRVPFRINVFQRAVRMIPTHKQFCSAFENSIDERRRTVNRNRPICAPIRLMRYKKEAFVPDEKGKQHKIFKTLPCRCAFKNDGDTEL